MTARSLPREDRHRLVRILVLLVLSVFAATLALAAMSGPAHAAGRVDVSQAPNADGSTTVTISGSGFQYLPNAQGGIYIFFGAVSDPSTNAWAPSQGGKSGSTFGYANTPGSTLLAAFQGGSSASEANAVIDPNGNWSAQMTIPGSTFASSSGNPHAGAAQSGATIDCLQVQCGIITIGAHGMVNANNESFTPVGFVTASGAIASGTAAQSFTDDATVLELPGAEAPAAQAEGDAAAEADASAPAGSTATGAEPAAEPSGEAEAGGFDTTLLVLGVLGVAVLALIAAVVVVLIKRARPRPPVAPAPNADPEGPAAPPAAEASAAPADAATPEPTTEDRQKVSAE